jgi:hypothetical protein
LIEKIKEQLKTMPSGLEKPKMAEIGFKRKKLEKTSE